MRRWIASAVAVAALFSLAFALMPGSTSAKERRRSSTEAEAGCSPIRTGTTFP